MDGLAQDHEKDGAAQEKATEGKDGQYCSAFNLNGCLFVRILYSSVV